MRLDGQLKMSHPLMKLANTLNWSALEKEFAGYFVTTRGSPALPPRLVAGLLYLQHAFSASDEMVVNAWLENRSGSVPLNSFPRFISGFSTLLKLTLILAAGF